MKSHSRHFEQEIFNDYKGKSSYLDIPAIDKKYYLSERKKQENLKFIYCGAFYKDTREPYIPLRIMSKVLSGTNDTFSIFTRNNYLSQLEREFSDVQNFVFSPTISQNKLINEMEQSDFLVSVGNKNSDFLPSKTIQYISTGRPIIHFSYDDYDTSLPYLNRYKNALVIYCNRSLEENVKIIKDFTDKTFSRVKFDDIYQEYFENTFEYTAEQFRGVINEIIGEKN